MIDINPSTLDFSYQSAGLAGSIKVAEIQIKYFGEYWQ
jgi:hypothetical protein